MIIINCRFDVRPELADRWLDITAELTSGSRAEEGCLWYDWARSVDDPNQFHLQEAWVDQAAIEAHNVAPHHTGSWARMRDALQKTPQLVIVEGDTSGWQPIKTLAVAD